MKGAVGGSRLPLSYWRVQGLFFWWGGEGVCFGGIEGWEVRDGGRKFF